VSGLAWDTAPRGGVWFTMAHYDRDGRYIIHHKAEGGYILTRTKLRYPTVTLGHFIRMDDAKAYAEAEHRERAA
jgi:hypothetical protein